jgi:hypothetical protein
VKRRRWKLEDLARLGVVERASRVKDGAPRVKGMSKTERAYKQHLDVLMEAGLVRAYCYEPFRVQLAPRCSYLPDYLVDHVEQGLLLVEVKPAKADGKAYWHEGSRTKVKLCAQRLGEFFGVRAAHPVGDGQWGYEQFHRLGGEV